MARIAGRDLEYLTTKDIRDYYLLEDPTDTNIKQIKEYFEMDGWGVHNRPARVSALLTGIIMRRFIKGKL